MKLQSFFARMTLAGCAILVLPGCEGAPRLPFDGDPQGLEVDVDAVSSEALKAAVTDKGARRFYQMAGWRAVWDEERSKALLEALAGAPHHGLSKSSFLPERPGRSPAETEAALTKAALDYATALARGFTDPARIHEIYSVPRPSPDLVGGLARAVADDSVDQWFASLPPQTEEYRALSRAFVSYLARSRSAAARAIETGAAIKPGERDPRVPAIREALAGNGYLPQSPRPDEDSSRATPAGEQSTTLYDPALVVAVRRMQADYGDDPDGIIGPATLQLLNTGAAARARQLAVNLERLRWLERSPPATRIDVNTAAAFLDYYRGGRLRDHRNVVVGEPGWETPSLGSPIYRLVANPTWTVPDSIYEDELAGKGWAYFASQNMVRKNGRIVQLPGPKNALGQVKLDMLNDQAIYLHDTPHKHWFAHHQRHRSHGCVRVHEAVEFARLIASDSGVLPAFDKALATGEEGFVDLKQRIPVRLIYQTAFWRDGAVRFRADPYGWDEDVARALGQQSRARRTLRSHQRGADVGP